MASTSPSEDAARALGGTGAGIRSRVTEALFDNLMLWTLLAAAIALLYLVWVTVDIVSHYVRGIPSVGP